MIARASIIPQRAILAVSGSLLKKHKKQHSLTGPKNKPPP